MNIMYVAHGYPPDSQAGVEVYTASLAKAVGARYPVSVFCREYSPRSPEYRIRARKEGAVDVYAINNTFKKWASFAHTYRDTLIAEYFGSLLDRISPDIVHVQDLLYLGVGIIEQAALRHIPVVFTLHDYWLLCPQGQFLHNGERACSSIAGPDCARCVPYQLGVRRHVPAIYHFAQGRAPAVLVSVMKHVYLYTAGLTFGSRKKAQRCLDDRKMFVNAALSSVSRFIAPSRYIRDRFVSCGFPAHKIACIPHGLGVSAHARQAKHEARAIRFGFIGNFLPAKGLHILLSAFDNIPGEKAELLIYGSEVSYKAALSGYGRRIVKMIRQGNIRLMGTYDNNTVASVFKNIDVLVVPSVWPENAPLVILEAFASGTPVIASNIGGIPEMVADNGNGKLCAPGDRDALRAEIMSVIEHPERIRSWRANIAHVRGIKDNAAEVENVYDEVLKEKV